MEIMLTAFKITIKNIIEGLSKPSFVFFVKNMNFYKLHKLEKIPK